MMTANERTVMYETVRSYLEETAPEELARLDESFDAFFKTADEEWRDLKASGREPGERGTPFDPVSFGAGTFVATLVWMALNLTRGAQAEDGRKERKEMEKRLRRLENRLAERSGYPEVVFELGRLLLEVLARESAPAVLPEGVSGEPDLRILIAYGRKQGRLAFSLTAQDRSLKLDRRHFESPSFQVDPEAWVHDLFQDLERIPCTTETERRVSDTKLRGAGSELAQRLLSPELRQCLGSLVGRVASVEITSEEPWIPWELMRLGGKDDGQFFCQAFAVTRWTEETSGALRFPLRKIAMSVPGDTDLPNLARERDFLLREVGKGREVVEVPATHSKIHEALLSGAWDAWHFAGHGTARSDNPNRRGLRLEEGELLTPQDLFALAGALKEKHPLIFLNACSGIRGGAALTGVAGLAEQFLQEGAGAVVGTRWGVPDSRAVAFAEAFYRSFLSGVPLGEAVRRSRSALRDEAPWDPAWLAYVAYGHPLAVAG